MGDMADWANENGTEELDAHRRGDCEGVCPYCVEEALQRKWKRNRLKQTNTKGIQ